MKFYISLVHYPVYNKNREIISTSIVIHDLHDISRAAKTYGVKKFFVVQPFEAERKIVDRIIKFWNVAGKDYNANRLEAISVLAVAESFQDVMKSISEECGKPPISIGTSAQKKNIKEISFKEVSELLKKDEPVLVVFGTGWGIADELINGFDYFLPPIVGISDFNHLSVRSACSIVLDRIIANYKELP